MSSSTALRRILKVLFIVALGFTVYSFVLGAPFKTLDDNISIVTNPVIKELKNAPLLFQSGYFKDRSYYRPLPNLSYMFEYHFFDLNPLFYYLTNIFLHLLNAALVFLIIGRILRDERTAFFVALLFAVHPVQWEAVANISGRAILMCSVFYLLALYFFLRCEKNKPTLKNNLIMGSSFFLALLSKENSLMLPLVLGVYQLLLGPKRILSQSFWAKIFWLIIPVVLYGALRTQFGVHEFYFWPSLSSALLGALTFLRATLTYLRIFILPVDMHFDRSMVLFESFWNMELLSTVFIYLLAIILLYRMRAKIPVTILFCIAWFYIELIPTSQIVSIGVGPGLISIAEHFLYLASIPAFTVVVSVVLLFYDRAVERKIISPQAGWILSSSVILFLGLTTVKQNIIATSEVAQLKQSLSFNPNNARMHSSLALEYAKRRYFKEAEDHFRMCLKLDPASLTGRIGLGKALCDQGRYWEGIEQYDMVQTKEMKWLSLLENNLRLTYALLESKYKDIIAQDPANSKAYYSLGIVYSKTGKTKEAIEAYGQALKIKPDDENALFNLGSLLRAQGQQEEAILYLKKALYVTKDDPQLEFLLNFMIGSTHADLKQYDIARIYFNKALSIQPNAKEVLEKLLSLPQQ